MNNQNKSKRIIFKNLSEIILGDVFSLPNILFLLVGALLIYLGQYWSLLFLLAIIPFIVINLVFDLKIYFKNKNEKNSKEGLVELKKGDICPEDVIIVDGSISVDESLFNGKSVAVQKNVNDVVYKNSFVVSGIAEVRMSPKDDSSRIVEEANKIKRKKNRFNYAIQTLLIALTMSAIVVAIIALVVGFIDRKFDTVEGFKSVLSTIGNSYISIVPAGLCLVLAIMEIVTNKSFKNKSITQHDLLAHSSFRDIDVLCLDKTGTLTDGTLKLKTIIGYSNYTQDSITQIISNILNVSDITGSVVDALKKECHYDSTMSHTKVLPYNVQNKYLGASFGTRGTYILGSIENLNVDNKSATEVKINEYVAKGYRVLFLGYSTSQINGDVFKDSLTPVALIILEENIRPEAIDTIRWLRENKIETKILSGDNANLVCEIAKSAGITNADKCVSLEGKSNQMAELLADNYTVFGQISPEQKEIIVNTLIKHGKRVAFVGNGINDLYALKAANCSIAMGDGCEEAKGISDIVLEDSNFHSLTTILSDSRKNFNNFKTIMSLFFAKSLFMFLAIMSFLIYSMVDRNAPNYPFVINNFYIWNIVTTTLASIFILFNNNTKPSNRSITKDVLMKGIPAGICFIIILIFNYVVLALRKDGTLYWGLSLTPYGETVYADVQIMTISALAINIFSIAVLFNALAPLDKKKKIYFSIITIIAVVALGLDVLMSFFVFKDNNLFKFIYTDLHPFNWLLVASESIAISAIYIFINYLIRVIKGENKNED